MLSGQIKPTVIKIFRNRWRYRRRGLPLMKPLRVVGWDMKSVLVADERVVRVYRVPWKDVQLAESERVMQVPVARFEDHSRNVDRRRERKPVFKAGAKRGG
jgi:hypothetical protein